MHDQLGITRRRQMLSRPALQRRPNSAATLLPSDLTAYRWRTIAWSIVLAGGAYARVSSPAVSVVHSR